MVPINVGVGSRPYGGYGAIQGNGVTVDVEGNLPAPLKRPRVRTCPKPAISNVSIRVGCEVLEVHLPFVRCARARAHRGVCHSDRYFAPYPTASAGVLSTSVDDLYVGGWHRGCA